MKTKKPKGKKKRDLTSLVEEAQAAAQAERELDLALDMEMEKVLDSFGEEDDHFPQIGVWFGNQ